MMLAGVRIQTTGRNSKNVTAKITKHEFHCQQTVIAIQQALLKLQCSSEQLNNKM